jgi:hypothetical protein
VLAERFAGSGGTVRWTNYLMVGGRYIGIHVENSDGTTVTRYLNPEHDWPMLADSESGWVCVSSGQTGGLYAEILPGAILDLDDEGTLRAVWLRPQRFPKLR